MKDDKLEEILKNIGAEELPADVMEIAEQTSKDFEKTLTQLKQPKLIILKEYLMKTKLTKISAAAAVIIIVVLVGLPFLSDKESGVALADVLAKVEEVKAYMYKINMKVTGSVMTKISPWGQDMTGTVTISEDFGMKTEMEMIDPNTGETTTQENYIIPDEKLMVMLMHEQKRFTRSEFSDDLLARMKKQHNNPRELIRQMLGLKYTELGKSEIDGVEVDGFETTDPRASDGTTGDVKVTLWVDSATWLPYLVEMDMSIDEQGRIRRTFYDYQWDVPIDASEFEPNIPADYTPMAEMQPDSGKTDEEKAIEALRMFAEITYGKYPSSLAIVTAMTEAGRALKDSGRDPNDEEEVNRVMSNMISMPAASTFYAELVRTNKDVIYYGDKVTAEDIGMVLMRWKVSDNEYRIIFGDLRIENVTAEELAELESLY